MLPTFDHLTPSHYEQLFRLEYRLDVFIKHQSKTEFGMGNFVSFPIKLKQHRWNLPILFEY